MKDENTLRIMTHMLILACEQELKQYLMKVDDKISDTCRKFLSKRASENLNIGEIDDPVGRLYWKDLWDHASSVTADPLISSALKTLARRAADSVILEARNSGAHGNRIFKPHYWYSLAAFVTSEEFIKLGFSKVEESLIKAELGDLNESVELETIDSYFSKTKNNLPEPDYLRTGYIGRSNELKKAKETLRGKRDHTIAITGPGGTGKTAFTLRLLNDVASEGTFNHIFFYTLKTEHLTADGVKSVSARRTLNNLLEAFEYWKIENQAEYDLENSQVCLCFDNIESIIEESFDDLFEFIDNLPDEWKVIFTSRIVVPNCRVISLTSLDYASSKRLAIEYSKSVGGESLLNLLSSNLDKIVENLSGNPLSIKVALDLINATKDINSSVAKTQKMISSFSFVNLTDFLMPESILILEYMRQSGWVSPDDIESALGLKREILSQALRNVQDTSLVERRYDDEQEIYLFMTTELSRNFLVNGGISEELREKVSATRRLQNDESRIANANNFIFKGQEHDFSAPDHLPQKLLDTLIKSGSILRRSIGIKRGQRGAQVTQDVSVLVSEWKTKSSTIFKNDYYYHLVLGRLLAEIDDQFAEEELLKAVKVSVGLENVRSRFVLGRFYMGENKHKEAREVYESLLLEFPNKIRAIQGLALSLQFTNLQENLIYCFDKLMEFSRNYGTNKEVDTLLLGTVRRLFQIPDSINDVHLEIGVGAAKVLNSRILDNPHVEQHVVDFIDTLLVSRARRQVKLCSEDQAIQIADMISTAYKRGSHFVYFEKEIGRKPGDETIKWMLEFFGEFKEEMFTIDASEDPSKHFTFDAITPEIEKRLASGDLISASIDSIPPQGRFCFCKDVDSDERFFVPYVNNRGEKWHEDLLDIGVILAIKPIQQREGYRTADEWFFVANV